MEEAEAKQFLESLLGKTLHIHIPDGRFFTGTFKCVDSDSNVILSNAFEYRRPTESEEKAAIHEARITNRPARANMSSRFMGLIVVPGKQIVKVEVEERRVGGFGVDAPGLGASAQKKEGHDEKGKGKEKELPILARS